MTKDLSPEKKDVLFRAERSFFFFGDTCFFKRRACSSCGIRALTTSLCAAQKRGHSPHLAFNPFMPREGGDESAETTHASQTARG